MATVKALAVDEVRLRGWYRFVWIAASFHFALVYTLNTRPMLDIAAFEAGTERLPFQLRVLTAWMLRLADRYGRFPEALQRHLPPAMASPETFAILALAAASMLIAVYATRRTLEMLTGDREASQWSSLLVVLMAYFHYLLEFGHPCCTPLQLPYDLPSLAFFAVGLLWVVSRRVALLYVTVLAGMLNRESIVFLIGIYLLYEVGLRETVWRAKTAMIHACVMFVLCLAIQQGLHGVYAHAKPAMDGGGLFENHAIDNLHFIVRPYYWASYLSMFGFTWLYLYGHWRQVPNRAIRYAMGIGPVMLTAMWMVGVLSEIRIFGELISLLAVAFVLLVRGQFGAGGGDEVQYLRRLSPALPGRVQCDA